MRRMEVVGRRESRLTEHIVEPYKDHSAALRQRPSSPWTYLSGTEARRCNLLVGDREESVGDERSRWLSGRKG